MNDYKLIERHIRNNRLQQSVAIAELIADGIVGANNLRKRLNIWVATNSKQLFVPPKSYSTSLQKQV